MQKNWRRAIERERKNIARQTFHGIPFTWKTTEGWVTARKGAREFYGMLL